MDEDGSLTGVKPQLIERKCGGWLAITPRGCVLSIGVTAETKLEAERAFEVALDRWSNIKETERHESA